MKNKRVLISGASIAGPALAYWLTRYGFDVTVVEKASELRGGGQAVDFKGHIHRTVLKKMGILDAVRAASVTNNDGILVNAAGRKVGTIPGSFAGGEINIPRGDLSRILYELTSKSSNYIFKDSITGFAETSNGVEVAFERSNSKTFDIVVGADGIHSNVRKLAFGSTTNFVHHLGYYYALVGIDAGDEDVMYNEPGRMVALGGSKAPAFFVFASGQLPKNRDNIEIQKKQLVHAFRNGSWRLPELIAKIPDAQEFYMDSISRVTMDHYSKDRIVLVGDSAYGNALGGFGTGLAIVGAYVLAGELFKAHGDYQAAFANYEKKFRNYASVSQKINAGRLLAPNSRFGIRLRNLMFSALSFFTPLMKLMDRPSTNLILENYDHLKVAGTTQYSY